MREHFPALAHETDFGPLVYFDNAATSQKPRAVIDRMSAFLQEPASNVARGVHTLGQERTEHFEEVRKKVARLINASDDREILFTSGCTASINLVARSYATQALQTNDVILCSQMEHHANIVPWQIAAAERGAHVLPIPLKESLEVDEHALTRLLSTHSVKLVAITHLSNALGICNPVQELISLCHEYGAKVLIDGAQSVAHFRVDMQQLDADFYAFGAHKMYGPSGVGVLYGKLSCLDSMPPFLGGGGMIETVSFEQTTYAEVPQRFEAGTPNIEGVVGLGAACDFLMQLYESPEVHKEQEKLFAEAQELFQSFKRIRVLGQDATQQLAILSFIVDGVHPHDVGSVLDSFGIAVRSGHHCCMPLMTHLGVSGTTRVSFGCCNHPAELLRLAEALRKMEKMFP